MRDNRALGSVLNNDINNILWACSGAEITPEEYQRAVFGLLDAGPGVLAQNVGMPDPVLYRSRVATTWDTYHTEVLQKVWPDLSPEEARKESDAMQTLMAADTDPLSLTIACCRERGVPVVASYRMNAEDFYHGELDAFDFGRAHRDWAIPGAHCLDPAMPDVNIRRIPSLSRTGPGRRAGRSMCTGQRCTIPPRGTRTGSGSGICIMSLKGGRSTRASSSPIRRMASTGRSRF